MSFAAKHSPPSFSCRPRAPSGLFLGLAGFLLFLPNTDFWMSQFQSFPGLFELVGGPIAVEISRLFTKLTAVGLVLALAVLKWRRPRSPLFTVVCAVSALTLVWSCSLSVCNGAGYMAIRSPSFLNLLIVSLAFLITCSLASRPGWWIPLFLGVASVALLKLAYSVVAYRHAGGVEITSGLATIRGDDGALLTQAFVAAMATVLAFEAMVRKRWKFAPFMAAVAAIVAVGMAASFRRLVVLLLVGLSLGGILLLSCLWGQLKRGLLVATAACAAMTLAISVTAVIVFGPEQAMDCLASLTLSSRGANKMGADNAQYVDEWAAFPRVLERSQGVGVGFGLGYGVHRLVDNGSPDFIPLHVGAFELWASLGFLGAIYQLSLFVVLPAAGIRRALRRKQCLSDAPLFSVSSALLLWTGLAPLGSPFHQGSQMCLLLGLALGCVVSADADVSHSLAAPAPPSPVRARHLFGPRPGSMRNPRVGARTFTTSRDGQAARQGAETFAARCLLPKPNRGPPANASI